MTKRWRELDAAGALKVVMWLFVLACLTAAAAAPDRRQMLPGLWNIYTTPAQLTKDYFVVGGVSAAFFNAFIMALLCAVLYLLPGAVVNGTSYLAFTLTVGFSFWGIHLLNALPCMLGTVLYCAVKREAVGKHVNFMIFATGLAPLVSDLFFRYPALQLHGLTAGSAAAGVAVGLFIGFLMPAGCSFSPGVHKGFSLYSAALPMGMAAIFLRALLYAVLGGQLPPIEALLGESRPAVFYGFYGALFAVFLLLGLWKNGWSFRGYGKLLKSSGHKTDLSAEFGPALALMNIGIYGLFIMLYYTVVGGSLNGVTFGLVLCMGCCAVAGSHPGNVWPIMVGYALAATLGRLLYVGEGVPLTLNTQAILVGMCYANGLSPVSGRYGWPLGILAGVLHFILVTCVPAMHGGFLLYNGGFAACLICIFLLPTLEHFVKTKEERLAAKQK